MEVDEDAFQRWIVQHGASEEELVAELGIDRNRVNYLKRKHKLSTHNGGAGSWRTAHSEESLPSLEELQEMYERDELHRLDVTQALAYI